MKPRCPVLGWNFIVWNRTLAARRARYHIEGNAPSLDITGNDPLNQHGSGRGPMSE